MRYHRHKIIVDSLTCFQSTSSTCTCVCKRCFQQETFRQGQQSYLSLGMMDSLWHFQAFVLTRQKPAYGRQGLDWIVRPGYSSNHDTTMETNWPPLIQKRDVSHMGPNQPPLIQKRDVTHTGPNDLHWSKNVKLLTRGPTDLLDV